jgi:Tol biopolymer transport system component
MALQPGDILSNDHYRLLRQLGRGGFGFVYLARDALLDEEVAIKELIPALVGDETMLKRFLAEAKATMRLTHKRIVRTHNVFHEGGNYYIVMEYMAGGSLEDRLREQGPLPVDEALRIATEVCEGLACAHGEGVVHCDLKPHNILFDAAGEAKVADFGIAHVSGEMLSRSWMTPAGFVAGTLPYMSPEQADGVRDDPRLDVYALGAVLYRMLTGRVYLDFDHRETPRAQMENVQRIYRRQPAPPSAHNPRIPPWLDAIILKALAKRPEVRYASAEELQAELLRQRVPRSTAPEASLPQPQPIRQPLTPTPLPSTPKSSRAPTPASAPARRLRAAFWPLAGVTGVVLVVLAIALVAALGGGEGDNQADEPAATTQVLVETILPLLPTEPAEWVAATAPPSPMPQTPTPPGGGGRIAFASTRDGNDNIYVMNPDGSGLVRLTHSPDTTEWDPAWSPDGRQIAFSSDMDGDFLEIYLMNADGSGVARLTHSPGQDTDPSWSPDGQRIAFLSQRGKSENFSALYEIYVMNADGGGARRLTDARMRVSSVAWSPDGSLIAFTADHEGGDSEIYVMNPDGSGVIRLTDNSSEDWNPSWSPDGRYIAFTSDRGGNRELYVMNADGSGVSQLTHSPETEAQGSWSPDGLRIAYTAYHDRSQTREIYVINADGSDRTRLTNNSVRDTDPSWSP